jgi:hypothetical protein
MPTDTEYQQIKQWYNQQFAGNVHEWFEASDSREMKVIVKEQLRRALNALTGEGLPAMDEATQERFNGIIDSAATKFMAHYNSEEIAGRNPDFTRTDSSFFQMFSSTLQNMFHEVAKLFRSSNPSVADLCEEAAKIVIAEAKKAPKPRDVGVRVEGVVAAAPASDARERAGTEEGRDRGASSVSIEDPALRVMQTKKDVARVAKQAASRARLGAIFTGRDEVVSSAPALRLPATLPVAGSGKARSPQPPRGAAPLDAPPPSLAESLRRSSVDVAPSGLGTISAPPLHFPENLPLPGIATDVKFTGGRGKGGR